jgi:precorrin-2/cobalt-factor-2 C20-methyltransferase
VRKSSLYLTDRLKAALADRAARTGRSEADLIRAALESALAVEPAEHVIDTAPADPAVPGRLVGVGVGPGDPDLLTTRAIVALRRADRVVAPATAVDAVGRAETIVRQAVPGLHVERVPFAMAPTRRARDRSVDQAASVVLCHLAAGEEVAWITLGDPLTYSTFSSVAERVRRKRPATTVVHVPGIMAFQALAARTGTVIADEHTRVAIRTALDGDSLSADLADPATTVVVYKGGRRLPELAREVASRRRGSAAAVAGELLGLPGERIGSLSALAAEGPASYLATVIVPAEAAAPPPRLTRPKPAGRPTKAGVRR